MKKLVLLLMFVFAYASTFSQTLHSVTSNGNSTSNTIELLNGAYMNINSGNISIGDAKISMAAFGNNSNGGYAVIQPSYHAIGYNTPLLINHMGGNVGIGSASPVEKLHVAGNCRSEGQLRFYTPHPDGAGITGIIGNPNGWTRIDPNGSRFIMTVTRDDVNASRNILDIEP